MKINIKKLTDRVKTPKCAYAGDACFDISVVIDEENRPMLKVGSKEFDITPIGIDGKHHVCIEPSQTYVLHTGLAFEIPKGHVMLIYARSSTGINRQLALTNGTGVIDSGYRGEVKICLTNIGCPPQVVSDGDRITQALIMAIPDVELVEVDELGASDRGANGIGSSGR